jgi:hypothetical protein
LESHRDKNGKPLNPTDSFTLSGIPGNPQFNFISDLDRRFLRRHRDDPLADMQLTEDGYYALTRQLATVADAYCGGRIVSILEGGYNLRALGRSVVKHLLGLSQPPG